MLPALTAIWVAAPAVNVTLGSPVVMARPPKVAETVALPITDEFSVAV